jgi:PBSX family phage terminase large subunit
MAMTKLSEVIAPSFYSVHQDIKAKKHTHYWLPGGRGSTKSSFVSVEIPLNMMKDAAKGVMSHAIVFRRYGVTLRESVFEQFVWAVNALGVSHLWQPSVSPMQLVYIPTGQKIIFRGADDATKVKSVKVGKGYIKYAWFEEVNEFESPEKIRSINQSVLRGGTDFFVFYSYNPPKAASNWVNQYVQIERADTIVHHSTYLSVPREWLGEQFITEAEHLQRVKPEAYAHEYLGEVTGTGGEVFDNVKLRKITIKEREIFDNLRRGIDWGYAADPFAYNVCHYDKTRRRLYIFDELHKVRLSNRAAADAIKREAGSALITCDSAEPKSIDEMRGYGLSVRGAKKGPDSVEYGIKWLQDLEEIIIDPETCPETAKEFSSYELDRDREGNFKAGFPDHNNHHIDAVRYACEGDMKRNANVNDKYVNERAMEEEFAMYGI